MALKFANNARSTIAGNITNVQTTITLATATGGRFPALAPGDIFHAAIYNVDGDFEVVHVTARTGDVLTVLRGREGTTARSFLSGSVLLCTPTKETMEYFYSPDRQGQGSGLNADLLRGFATATTAAANTIPVRDANGALPGNLLGNAGTAAALQTARTINGVSFNGTANITITANTPGALTFGAGFSAGSFNGGAATIAMGTPGTLSTTSTNQASGQTHTHKVNFPAPTAAQVGTAAAGLAVGAVGTYAFMRNVNKTTLQPGATIAGSALRYAGIFASGNNNNTSILPFTDSPVPEGTWRCMGFTVSGGTGTGSLFLRIS